MISLYFFHEKTILKQEQNLSAQIHLSSKLYNYFLQKMRTRFIKLNKLSPIDLKKEKSSRHIEGEGSSRNQKVQESPYKEEYSHSQPLIGLIEETIRKELKISNSRIEMEARDCLIELELPNEEGHDESLSDEVLKEWITDLCNSVFSAAFNFFSKDMMSLEYTKIFCSECIVRNIFRLTQHFRLKNHQMRVLNQHISKDIVPYMQRKYPLTESQDVNKAIDKCVRPIDNRQALNNDMLQKSDLMFTWRQSGDYSDLIMKFLNQIMTQIDKEPDNQEGQTPYEQFYSTMSDIFENVFDQKWMKNRSIITETRQMRRQRKLSRTFTLPPQQKLNEQRYASKVKQYTKYSIDRKISKNIPCFTDQQIENGQITIKHSSILRILTKWCEQLWRKFTTKNYFLDRQENLRVQQVHGNVNTMFMWMKMPLNDLMEKEKKQIEEFMKEVTQHNFDQQSLLLLKELQNDGFTHVQKIERASGKYATKTVNNLHTYIILYLNRIIHGLLTVSKELYESKLSSKNRWTAPPDLMSFKVGDIMRCKCSSKQVEILKIFKELQRVCEQEDSNMKIIRIKNRLKLGTNDILINVLFKQKFICEIQLAVESATSKFIQCSNMFSHYIYELGRTLFGPITELCSVWISLDARALEYQRIVRQEKRVHAHQLFGCKKEGKDHQYIQLNRPFICHDCQIAYSSPNFIWAHQKCVDCSHMICARCRLQNQKDSKLHKQLLEDEEEAICDACDSIANRRDKKIIPEFGLCIQINSKKIVVQRFRKLQVKNTMSVYGISHQKEGKGKIYLIKDLLKPDDEANFLKNYIVFEIPFRQAEKLLDITKERVNKEYVIPQKVQEIYKKEKEIMSLIEADIEDKDLQIITGKPKMMAKIRNMELADNKITKVDIIANNFPNLGRLQLSRNKIDNIQHISKLSKLAKLNLRNNQLKALPSEICKLSQLKSFNFRHNQIEELPQDFKCLTKLTKLEADNNLIAKLPAGFQNLVNLVFLNLSNNKLTEFPIQVKQFKELGTLKIAENKGIKAIPDWIGELYKLKMFDAKGIGAENLPEQIFYLSKLSTLKVSSSCNSLSPRIGQLRCLKELSLQMPNIEQLPQSMLNLHQLELLQLEECPIHQLPDFLSEMKKLEDFALINNQLNSISKEIFEMKKLKYLKIERQNISQLPMEMQQLTDLRTLSLNHNKFIQVPEVVRHFTKLYHFSMSNNQIQSIPDNFFEPLENLENVLFNNNQLKEVPFSISQLKKLKKYQFEGNPDLKEPEWFKAILEGLENIINENLFHQTLNQSLAQMF